MGAIICVVGKLSSAVTAGYHLHGCIVGVRIVNREPDRNCLLRGKWPVLCILMPGHFGSISRVLHEKLTGPLEKIWPDQVFNIIQNGWVAGKIVERAAVLVPQIDLIDIGAIG